MALSASAALPALLRESARPAAPAGAARHQRRPRGGGSRLRRRHDRRHQFLAGLQFAGQEFGVGAVGDAQPDSHRLQSARGVEPDAAGASRRPAGARTAGRWSARRRGSAPAGPRRARGPRRAPAPCPGPPARIRRVRRRRDCSGPSRARASVPRTGRVPRETCAAIRSWKRRWRSRPGPRSGRRRSLPGRPAPGRLGCPVRTVPPPGLARSGSGRRPGEPGRATHGSPAEGAAAPAAGACAGAGAPPERPQPPGRPGHPCGRRPRRAASPAAPPGSAPRRCRRSAGTAGRRSARARRRCAGRFQS